jgi:uncharacterized protein (DUF362 family)
MVIDQMLDDIGGIGDLVQGKTVTIKLNLTGFPDRTVDGQASWDTYQVHPDLVAAVCAAISEAGATRIVLVESSYTRGSIEEMMTKAGWDLARIATAGDQKVTWEDTRYLGEWSAYSELSVPDGGDLFPAFWFNPRYEQTDVMVSIATLKQHEIAGITLSMKNMFGSVPISVYGATSEDGVPVIDERCITNRSTKLHAGELPPPAGVPQEIEGAGIPRLPAHRVPHIIADIVSARPVDLGIIDGIHTMRGGEGYWNAGVGYIEPGLLLAGRNGVCLDAVGVASMGFDPMAATSTVPFPGENHLQILNDRGIGTNDLSEIEVIGLPLEEAVFPFAPRVSSPSMWILR